MNKEKITIQDIADSLGLSRNTVSKALNNHPSLPGDTHSKVIQRATEMNYKHARIDLNESFCILEDDRYFADYKWLKERLASMKKLPSAFVCANDFIAIHVIRILKDLNIRIPEEVMVCGFDNAPESRIVEPHLTTVHIHRSEMGFLAAEMLLSRIENPDRPPQVTYVKTKPIFHQSTGHV
ncbi:LacI family DNA-binding transcriptional regulator [Paenibacillus sp. FSL L8-0463]|uniref:LacI family DNA-binding transcriptional regulator n=1 Tax=Paenibacillus sp. FSL L8-0463 TaxID=2954687 RepID=UPI00311A329A